MPRFAGLIFALLLVLATQVHAHAEGGAEVDTFVFDRGIRSDRYNDERNRRRQTYEQGSIALKNNVEQRRNESKQIAERRERQKASARSERVLASQAESSARRRERLGALEARMRRFTPGSRASRRP